MLSRILQEIQKRNRNFGILGFVVKYITVDEIYCDIFHRLGGTLSAGLHFACMVTIISVMDVTRRFSEQVIANMRSAIEEADGNEVFFVGRINDDGLIVSVELGARGRPANPFLRNAVDGNIDKINDEIVKAISNAVGRKL